MMHTKKNASKMEAMQRQGKLMKTPLIIASNNLSCFIVSTFHVTSQPQARTQAARKSCTSRSPVPAMTSLHQRYQDMASVAGGCVPMGLPTPCKTGAMKDDLHANTPGQELELLRIENDFWNHCLQAPHKYLSCYTSEYVDVMLLWICPQRV